MQIVILSLSMLIAPMLEGFPLRRSVPAPSINQSKWDGPWPTSIVVAAAASMGDGKVYLWASSQLDNTNTGEMRTYYAMYDPVANEVSPAMLAGIPADMFCPSTTMLSDGTLMVSGGVLAGATVIFDGTLWTNKSPLKIGRGYNSAVLNSDGSVFTHGGSWSGGYGRKMGELWTAQCGWRVLSNVPPEPFLTADASGVYRADNHFWLVAVTPGWVFHAGPSRAMHWISLVGQGAVIPAGLRGNDTDAMNGNAVLYSEGRIVTFGGATNYDNGICSSSVFIIDISAGPGHVVSVRQVTPMSFTRAFHNSVLLPSGEVVVIGGQAITSFIFDDNNAVYVPELWDPVTETFTLLKPMATPRTYHSTAILLIDGRVLSSGGGACGTCGVNHLNYEILTPPYLLQPDGSPAIRPQITQAPAEAFAGFSMEVEAVGAATFVFVRMSSVTHSINTDQRRIPITNVTVHGDGRYTLGLPDIITAIPGNYMLFAMSSSGAPSIAKVFKLNAVDMTTVAPVMATGLWGTTSSLPFVAIAAAIMADGKVLFHSKSQVDNSGNALQSYFSTYDPATDSLSPALLTGTMADMLRPATALLSDGKLMVSAAKSGATAIFNGSLWTNGSQHAAPVGYMSEVTTADGSVLALGGCALDTRWRCVKEYPMPVRYNGADFECLGAGNECAYFNGGGPPCQQLLSTVGPVTPALICGLMHQQIYGSTGYDASGHWCNIVGPALIRDTMVGRACLDLGEVWTAQTGWRALSMVSVDSLLPVATGGPAVHYSQDNVFWLFAAAPGWVFHAGPSRAMHWIGLDGEGDVMSAGSRSDDTDATHGSAVMYGNGKIISFSVEKNQDYQTCTTPVVCIIDITAGPGLPAVVRRVSSMIFPRVLHNSVLLPSGEVLIIGGKKMYEADPSSDADAVLIPELWNPITETFTALKRMTAPRTYYSVALLLVDGRVLSSGGGACGSSCSANHSDYEIFSPQYLLQPDGSPAIRPQITQAPAEAFAGSSMEVEAVGAATFVFVRMSSATHTVNNDQRRIPITNVTVHGDGRYTLGLPSVNQAVPCNYMLFAMSSSGAPSIAKVFKFSTII